jgi:hypothetical protein
MADNLRDRIAYAIAQADGDPPGMEPASLDYEMADAVIEAIGLRQETVGLIHRGLIHRWVTDWTDPTPPAPRGLWDIFAEADKE